jgi:hypothetical protein
MKKIGFNLLILSFLTLAGCGGGNQGEITFVGGTSRWIFTNGVVSVVVKPAQGIYDIVRTRDQQKIITGAYLKIGEDSTNATGRTFDHTESDFVRGDESGKYLLVTSSGEGKPGLGLRFGLLPGKDYVVIDAGIMNKGDSVLRVKEMSVLTNGLLYGGKALGGNFRMLDGNGGGEDTRVTGKTRLDCRNNFMLTWGEPKDREVLVAGGLTYSEIEKFVKVRQEAGQEQPDMFVPAGLSSLVAWDAGKSESVDLGGAAVKLVQGKSYQWESGAGSVYDDIVYDKEAVIIGVSGLKEGKAYAAAVAWSDDADSRVQSVLWEADGKEPVMLMERRKLPSHGSGGSPEEAWVQLPGGGSGKLIIRNEGGVNAVVSAVRILEGKLDKELAGKTKAVEEAGMEPKNLMLTLYAMDPVGKRVDPGQSWFPEDAFYVSAEAENPFVALESYGKVLKEFLNSDLEYYTFPTVCLWYAQHYMYGDGPAVNDAPGAVAEMDRAVASGFLKYTQVAIRLVPDAYEENNEQGWWDDKHWQMHGTGKYATPPDRNVDVAPGHYKKPYETTAKWAQAVIDRGGIPLTYFQTGRRSDDYAEAFPEHMLWNSAEYPVNDQDWMIKGKTSYDFTDPGFISHMQEVYKNLADGGVQGLMYDYPYTAWARFGGMEDKYSTTASAYRTVFQLARNGLGPEAYLDERNLDHGSDITLGIVSSQRIWGDTDRMSPLMISRGVLRWYKNRLVVSYDMDAKNLLKAQPENPDGIRKMLTLMYTTCGRFLMANSFARLSPEMVHDLSRIFPYPDRWISARPADAFTSRYPEVFVFHVQDGWDQLVVYNPDDKQDAERTISFNSADYFGAFSIDEKKTYYAYEFWDDRLAGEFAGSEPLKIKLRPGEAKMISIREKSGVPQLLSTDRHIMQGLIETGDLNWDAEKLVLTGRVNLVAGEEMGLVFAVNGYKADSVTVENGLGSVTHQDTKLLKTVMKSDQAGWHIFTVQFSKP